MSEKEDLFTTRMRKATRKIHSVSDALVNAKFAISLTNETVWGGGLFVFYHIFAFLEDAKERLNLTDFNSLFVNRALFRKKAFEEDLKHYLGDNWTSQPKPQALENYLEHLRNLETEQPSLLMAYAYHLYLGLLSGGQILAKKRRMFGEKTKSESTYVDMVTDFQDANISEMKQQIKDAMNKIAEGMSEDELQAFIEESNQVFLMNNLIVHSVAGQNKVLCDILYKLSTVAIIVGVTAVAYKMFK